MMNGRTVPGDRMMGGRRGAEWVSPNLRPAVVNCGHHTPIAGAGTEEIRLARLMRRLGLARPLAMALAGLAFGEGRQ